MAENFKQVDVAVITRHAVINYGSLLQSLATQNLVEALGYTCKVIDYIRTDEHYKNTEKVYLKRNTYWANNKLKKVIYLAIRQPESWIVGRKFEKERLRYLNLTRRFSSLGELTANKPHAKIYATGSDQVWGPIADEPYDDAYFLAFTENCDIRVSVAASFGPHDIKGALNDHIKEKLKTYGNLSVREEEAVKIIAEMGIKARQILDPTLLLSSETWSKYCWPVKRKRKYILIYQLHDDLELGKYAKAVARKAKLPLLRVSPYYHHVVREGKLIWCPNIRKFLSYINNAECLITDSFHGTAFALNFNTPFVDFLNRNDTGVRQKSLLKLTGLSNRVLKDISDIDLAFKPVDFTYANKVLAEKRKEGMEILSQMLGEKR